MSSFCAGSTPEVVEASTVVIELTFTPSTHQPFSFFSKRITPTSLNVCPLDTSLPGFVTDSVNCAISPDGLSASLLVRKFASVSINAPANVEMFHLQASDRKSTRLNSSHLGISYAVFCLQKQQRGHLRIDLHRQGRPPLSGYRVGRGAARRSRLNHRLPVDWDR